MPIKQCILLCLLLLAIPLQAAIEEYAFDSPAQEQRFKKLTYELRCPKCLNSNLAGSDAPIAADLRHEIYEQIREGRSNDEIIEFMTSRYGDFMLYRPRLTLATFFLWFGPALLLIAGFFIVRRMMIASQALSTDTELSAEEEQKLHSILDSKPEQ
jgi:cytochrome c-type biogenesis protein CcmH